MPDPSLQPLIHQGWTALHPILTSIGAGSLTALLVSTWLTARLKGSVDAKYARALETLKSELKSEADGRLEAHKADLGQRNNDQLERLRSMLAAENAERHTLLAALTTRRFDAIAKVHAGLLRFHAALAQLTAPMRFSGTDEQELLEALVEANRAFDETLMDNEVFLTEGSARLVKDIRQKLTINGRLFAYAVVQKPPGINWTEKWAEIDTAVRGPIRDALEELARELRALMGDKSATAVPNDRVGRAAATPAAGL
ncbi:hypothetical protein [Paraburkholderia tropica]|uniref:hypothetical protein n=1 Tax=Paraburkholderia tropica TaxID=92647 RepID=UPI002AB24009|nr:hypothetical protein [Paraburkholderia tropica]